jgi:exodeoxyribonuclease VII large subunit
MSEKRPKPGETIAFDFAVFAPAPPKKEEEKAAAPAAPAAPAVAVNREPVSAPVASPEIGPRTTATATATARVEKPAGPPILTVAQLGRILTRTLERNFSEAVWVEGEITGARPASSGHLYFCLKDEDEEAVVDCVVYRGNVTPRSKTLVKDGVRIRLRGKPTFWSPRGKMQFIGDRIEPTGKGALLEALERLKQKLAAEGLFAQERKRPLPHDPRIIGVVTSAGGAVIHDICKVSFRRGGARILLAPALVQGAGAAEAVRRSLAALQRIAEVDVIIVGRGGGSQDDLLAFHDEQLVRDIAACRVPVVSAVGHETDITLVDFAADARASTPSQAAEMVVPDANGRRRLLEERDMRLRRAVHARIADERARTAKVASAFRDPRLLIASAQQRVDDHVVRMSRIVTRTLARDRETATRLGSRLGAAHPRARIARDTGQVLAYRTRLFEIVRARLTATRGHTNEVRGRLVEASRARLGEERREISGLAGRLDAMSPLKVLSRGYAIATREKDGRAVRDASEVARGDRVHVRVGAGSFDAEVTDVEADASVPRSKK